MSIGIELHINSPGKSSLKGWDALTIDPAQSLTVWIQVGGYGAGIYWCSQLLAPRWLSTLVIMQNTGQILTVKKR